MTVDELVYLASEFACDGAIGPDSGFEKYLEMIMKTWNALKAIDPLPLAGRQAITYPSWAAGNADPVAT